MGRFPASENKPYPLLTRKLQYFFRRSIKLALSVLHFTEGDYLLGGPLKKRIAVII
jgi:hypothetical protein